MSYTALYRKLRPRRFADVVGQPHIVTTLVNQIKTGRISHAYLFCGTRGTGKTTTAKIFAQAANCANAENGEPCGECPSCVDILSGRSMNVLEIDAASNNGVDNVREIREDVRYAPTEGKYRIYIIDETHMLSAGAFNALLKTLEEPPSHAVFILATTDPQKIPATVMSRVQRFDFRRIPADIMLSSMKAYMADEGVNADGEALSYIARASDGAMRDALSILDQCMSFYYGQDITLPQVLDVLGAVDVKALFDMTDALARYDCPGCLSIIDGVAAAGRDINQFVTDLITHFRDMLMVANIGAESTALALSAESLDRLRTQAANMSQNTLMEFVRAFSQLHVDMRYAANRRVLLEVTCIKLCNPAAEASAAPEELLRRVERLEALLDAAAFSTHKSVKNETVFEENMTAETPYEDSKGEKPVSGTEAAEITETAKGVSAAPKAVQAAIDGWDGFAASQSMPLAGFLRLAKPGWLGGNALAIVSDTDMLKNKEQDLKTLLSDAFGADFDILFLAHEDYDKRARKKGPRE